MFFSLLFSLLAYAALPPVTIGTANGLSITVPGTNKINMAAADASTTGALTASDWNTFNNKWGLSGNASTTPGTHFVGTTDAQDLVFKTDGAERARFLSTGNLGLGTSAPPKRFSVLESGTITSNLYADTIGLFQKSTTAGTNSYLAIVSGNTGVAGLGLGDTDSDVVGQIYYNNNTNFLGFASSGSTRGGFDSAGDFGVGTASPDTKLHVVAGGTAISSAAATTAVFQNSTTTGSQSSVSIVGGTAGTAALFFGDTASDAGFQMFFSNVDNSFQVLTGGNPALEILSNGNVGFNEISPQAQVSILGTAGQGNIELDNDATSTYLQSYDRSTSAYKPFRIKTGAGAVGIFTSATTGAVGLNTNSPGAQLDVRSSAAGTVGQIIQGAVSQTADLTDWKNSAGTTLASVSAAGNLSAANFAGSTYTPTLTNVANLDASTAYQAQYIRIGSTVTVSGRVDIDPTAAATLTQLGISLPVASNIGAVEDCAGTAFASGVAGQGAAILGDAANNRAQLEYISGDTTNQAMYFTFTYQIL